MDIIADPLACNSPPASLTANNTTAITAKRMRPIVGVAVNRGRAAAHQPRLHPPDDPRLIL